MNSWEDDLVFKRMDRLNRQQILSAVGSLDSSEDPGADQETFDRIKRLTFQNLGLPGTTARPRLNKKRILSFVASFITVALLTITATAALSPDVRAQLRKIVSFIPGFASVESTEGQVYVLPSPIVVKVGDGQIEIRGISINDKHTIIELLGKGVSWNEKVILKNEIGEQYSLSHSMIGSSSGLWSGTYYFEGTVHVTERMNIFYDEKAEAVPIKLVAAKQADRIQDLGITAIRNGIGLTAISAPVDKGKTKVSIIPEYAKDSHISHINTYGFYDKQDKIDTNLQADDGKKIAIEGDAILPKTNEFYYAPDASEKVHLAIPALDVTKRYDRHETISVPVPNQGTLNVNKSFNLFDHPLTITKVERFSYGEKRPEGLRLYLDLHYKAGSSESLLYFLPDFTKEQKSGGSSFKVNDSTRAMEYMELEVQPGDTEITFYVNELHVRMRGPWEFDLPR